MFTGDSVVQRTFSLHALNCNKLACLHIKAKYDVSSTVAGVVFEVVRICIQRTRSLSIDIVHMMDS